MHIHAHSTLIHLRGIIYPHEASLRDITMCKKMFEKPKIDPQWSKVNPSNPLKVYEKIIVQMTTHSMILI